MNGFSKACSTLVVLAIALSIGACGGGGGGSSSSRAASPTTPTVTVTPASSSVTTAQSLSVTVAVSGASGTPTGSIALSSGGYASTSTVLSSGSASITIPAGSLAAGTDTLTAAYTPDSSSSSTYGTASGTAAITVTQAAKVATVTVTPEETSHPYAENLIVTTTVMDGSAALTGNVTLTSGSFTSAAVTLNSGKATFYIQPGSLAEGADTLTVTYVPDSGSSSYATSTGTAELTLTSPGTTNVTVSINTLANRHLISPYIYGVNTSNINNVKGENPTLVRFGGNAASDYNWKLFTYNAAADWFFEDYGLGNTGGLIPDSVQLTSDTVGAGSHMLTTMAMLDWVAKGAGNWSYSVKKFGPQCATDPWNSDAGNGLVAGSTGNCATSSMPVTTQAVTDAYVPLVNTTSDCTTGNCIYRQEWTNALAAAFGTDTCNVPYSSITTCHFFDLDNEPEIWDGSHRDVHPVHPGYTELTQMFLSGATNLKTWDPSAVTFGPVVCCWNYYWTAGPSGDDKNAHAGVDYLPYWLNRVAWEDQISGKRSLDVLDVHAYVGSNVDTTGFTNAELRANAVTPYRMWWDPKYYNAGFDASWITTTQPNRGITFSIPRLKALANAIYPGTPVSFSEWETFFNEWEFATALSDADAFGIAGREGLSFSTRWGGPDQTDATTNLPHPNYRSIRLYTNYDGANHAFGSMSVWDQTTANADLFTSYASLDSSNNTLYIMVLNKDPGNAANVTFNLGGFNASTFTAYTVASTNPGSITTSASQSWSATQSFQPYTITLLVISGTQTGQPASEWYLNPDDLMIPASGTGILNPKIMSGTANVTLSSAVFDAFEGAPACSGSLTLTNATITPATPATITVNPGSTPGFCHYTVTGSDGVSTQTEGGWIVVGNPAGTLAKTSGDGQTGSQGSTLSQALTVTFDPKQSGMTTANAEVLFSTSAGTLTSGTTSGSKVITTTNSSGVASVTLTLPLTAGPVTVTAQGQFAAGAPLVTFTETAN